MPICEICTSGVTGKSPGSQCAGSCQKFFHAKCIDSNKADIPRFSMPGVSWSCKDCRNPAANERQSLIIAADDSDLPATPLVVLMDIQKT
ncbi:hypothetical protein JTB14_023271 [Gonioctena quinquepunctata]|nr:hypothetical protein JTB14_023271 [Gonioctena quinquepunctata]